MGGPDKAPGVEANKKKKGRLESEAAEVTLLRSADMGRCRLAVVHTRYWEAYRNLLKLVEFRSPLHLIPFFPGNGRHDSALFLECTRAEKG